MGMGKTTSTSNCIVVVWEGRRGGEEEVGKGDAQ